jgi:hypothetical protein
MAAFNRVVVTLLLLALIPIVTVGLIVPEEGIQLLRDLLDEIDSRLDPSPSTLQTLIVVVLALVIDVMLVILLYLELRRPAPASVPVRRVEGGEAQIAIESVVSRVGYQVDRLPGVLAVTPTVIPRRGGVEVVLDIEMAANGNLSTNIEEISAVTRRVIEEDMGLKLKGKPKLNLRTVEYPGPAPVEEIQGPFVPTFDEAPSDEELGVSADPERGQANVDQELNAESMDEPGSADAES